MKDRRSEKSKPTLEYILRPDAIPSTEIVRRYPTVVPLVARILGVVPRVFSYLEIWPPAFQSYSLIVPAFFNLPFCDLGFGIGSKNRSLVAYASSRGHGCMYCAAHSAALGNVFTGARGSLHVNAEAVQDGVCPLRLPAERALVEYGLAVGKGGSSRCESEMESLRTHFTDRQIEDIVLVAATMGLLNRCLDTLGMVLERSLLDMGRENLASSGWTEDSVYQAEFDEDWFSGEPEVQPNLGFWGLLRCLVGAIRFESQSLSRFPRSKSRQESFAREVLGFCPSYLLRFQNGRARKTLLHLLVDRLIAPNGGLSPALRCSVGMIFAQENDARVLFAHFGFLASRADSAEAARLLPAVMTAGLDEGFSPIEQVCFRTAREASGAPVQLSPEAVQELSEHLTGEQIIELVLVLSITNLLLRILRSFPQEMEPEIARFASRAASLN